MAKIQSLTQYKKALILSKDLKSIIPILDNCLLNLKPHSKYIPVQHICASILENRQLLLMYIKKYNKVIKEKGLIN